MQRVISKPFRNGEQQVFRRNGSFNLPKQGKSRLAGQQRFGTGISCCCPWLLAAPLVGNRTFQFACIQQGVQGRIASAPPDLPDQGGLQRAPAYSPSPITKDSRFRECAFIHPYQAASFSFFLRAARGERETSPSLSMK